MPKSLTKKVLIYVLIVIIAFVAAYFSYAWGKKAWPFGEEKYQVVQLASGEVYYGKLRTFPSFKLFDAYFIQKTESQPQKEGETPQPQMQLVPISAMFFAPENAISLNKSQVLWWTNLSPESQILKTIKEMKK